MNLNNRAIDEAALMASAIHSSKTSWKALFGFGRDEDQVKTPKNKER
jgi:hypothetical protein